LLLLGFFYTGIIGALFLSIKLLFDNMKKEDDIDE